MIPYLRRIQWQDMLRDGMERDRMVGGERNELYGGYDKGSQLQKIAANSRFERSFKQMFPRTQRRGETFIGYDYAKKGPDGKPLIGLDGTPKLQGTAWVTAAKKAYKQFCADLREEKIFELLMKDEGLENSEEARALWDSLSRNRQAEYRRKVANFRCPKTEIRLRETTPGNEMKKDFTYREKTYLLETMLVDRDQDRGTSDRILFRVKITPVKEEFSQQECQEWVQGGKETNPKTGYTIQKNGQLYLKIEKACQKYDIEDL